MGRNWRTSCNYGQTCYSDQRLGDGRPGEEAVPKLEGLGGMGGGRAGGEDAGEERRGLVEEGDGLGAGCAAECLLDASGQRRSHCTYRGN